jgi:hypothetical protein
MDRGMFAALAWLAAPTEYPIAWRLGGPKRVTVQFGVKRLEAGRVEGWRGVPKVKR